MRQRVKKRPHPKRVREALLFRGMPGHLFASKVFEFKSQSSPDELFDAFPALFVRDQDLARIHGELFPRSVKGLFDQPALFRPADATNEIAWAAALCRRFSKRLSAYVAMRAQLQRALLIGREDEAKQLILNIEEEYGISIWLLQVQLAASQLWGTPEERHQRTKDLESEAEPQSITRVLLRFLYRRAEPLRTKNKLKEELAPVLHANSNYALQQFLKEKILNPLSPMPAAMASVLMFEAQSSLIDLYEALIRRSQLIATDPNIPAWAGRHISRFLRTLYKAVPDRRLVPVLAALAGQDLSDTIDQDRARLIELYMSGNYEEFLNKSATYSSERPEDVALLSMRVRAATSTGREVGPYPGLSGELSSHLQDLFSLTEDAYGPALSIFALAEQFSPFDWAKYAHALTLHELREEELESPSYHAKTMVVLDHEITPLIRYVWPNRMAAHHIETFSKLSQSYPLVASGVDLATRGIEPIAKLGAEEYLFCKLNHLIGAGEIDDALSHIVRAQAGTRDSYKARLKAMECAMYVALSKWQEATAAAVQAHIEMKVIAGIFPLNTIAEGLELPERWGRNINVPLFFHMYTEHMESDRLPHLRLSFEMFLQSQAIERPDEFGARANEFGLEKAIAFLDDVWTPEVMRQTILYSSADMIDAARVEVCRVLSDLDPKNRERYTEEIRDRIKKREISRAAKLVEQSKVYVDVAAIKRSLRARLGGSYARYKTAVQGAPSGGGFDRIFDVLAQVELPKDRTVTQILSTMEVLGDVPRSEADAQFDSLFSEILQEFLFGDHGLNAYLSTRVRHGKLTRALRKAVENESLVTSRREGATSYLPNDFWNEKLRSNSSEDSVPVSTELAKFAAAFDAILEEVNQKIIRISVVDANAVRSEEDSQAAFNYWSTQLERKFIQNADRESASVEELVDRCVQVLWEKTDQSLARLRALLDTTVRAKLNRCFESLQHESNELGIGDKLDGFNNSIARARTETNTRLSEVVRWFKRSEVYDRQDYSLEFAVHIAKSSLDKTLSGSDRWSEFEVVSELDRGLMPGRTLDGMVDIFDNLLVNATKRSGLPLDQLDISVRMRRISRRYVISVTNSVAASAYTEAKLKKLSEIRGAIELRETKRLAQIESGSGLFKVWRALHSPGLEDPLLEFKFVEDRFVVDLAFSLENSDEAASC